MAPAADKVDDRSADRDVEVSIPSRPEAERAEESGQSRVSMEDVVLLDDLAFCAGRRGFSLSEPDLLRLEALLAVLESGLTDIPVKKIGHDVSDELEWA